MSDNISGAPLNRVYEIIRTNAPDEADALISWLSSNLRGFPQRDVNYLSMPDFKTMYNLFMETLGQTIHRIGEMMPPAIVQSRRRRRRIWTFDRRGERLPDPLGRRDRGSWR